MSAMKEPHFFSTVDPRGAWTIAHDQEEYLALFADRQSETYAGESSPSYLWDPETADRISSSNPAARIIMVLRDPTKRAHSHFLMDVREGRNKGDFLDAIQSDYGQEEKGWGISHLYVELGLYAEAIERFRGVFGKQNVAILVFEEFVRDPNGTLAEIATFLDLPTGTFDSANTSTAHNPYREPRVQWIRRVFASGMPASIRKWIPKRLRQLARSATLRKAAPPTMDGAAESYLHKLFSDDIKHVEKLLGRPLPWDRSS